MRKNILWKILIYFIVYSVLGFYIETIFAILTKGTLESRQSFLFGPFCMVYGVGAICLILSLNKYKNNIIKLFIYGMVVGAFVEYFSSYIGELIMHIKWWDYSNSFMNIHGRTCLFYAICWGILSIFLIKYINPNLDKVIKKIFKKPSLKFHKIVISCLMLFLIFDALISVYALDVFLTRVSDEYNIKIIGVKENTRNDSFSKMFSNEKILQTYPNMLVLGDDNKIIEIKNILNDVPNYYYKINK